MKLVLFSMILIICTCCKQRQQRLVDSPIKFDKEQAVPKSEHQPLKVSAVKQKKFDKPIEFSKFKVDTFNGRKSPINYKSHLLSRQFRTIITETYINEGLNFGGHYTIVIWGCGTSCQYGAIIDHQTGNVYPIPSASGGYDYKKNSRLLVVNPPDNAGFYDDCSYCVPQLWVWIEEKKKFQPLN